MCVVSRVLVCWKMTCSDLWLCVWMYVCVCALLCAHKMYVCVVCDMILSSCVHCAISIHARVPLTVSEFTAISAFPLCGHSHVGALKILTDSFCGPQSCVQIAPAGIWWRPLWMWRVDGGRISKRTCLGFQEVLLTKCHVSCVFVRASILTPFNVACVFGEFLCTGLPTCVHNTHVPHFRISKEMCEFENFCAVSWTDQQVLVDCSWDTEYQLVAEFKVGGLRGSHFQGTLLLVKC
mgnify:FL=1